MISWDDVRALEQDCRELETDDFYEEEDVLIAEVTHTCCGRLQGYYNCALEAVPSPEALCRDCQPQPALAGDDFVDPFGEES